MKLDKKTIDGLMKLSDDKLLSVLKLMLAGKGNREPDARTVAGIRNVMSRVTEADVERAVELIELYKKGKKT